MPLIIKTANLCDLGNAVVGITQQLHCFFQAFLNQILMNTYPRLFLENLIEVFL